MSVLVVVLAVLLLGTVLQDAFEVMLLPRRVERQVRLARMYFRVAWAGWVRVARLLPAGGRRIRFLGTFGPLSMVVLFALWAALLIGGFGMLEWVAQGRLGKPSSLGDQMYMSGATFFTLGYGDIVPHAEAARVLAVVEAGTGLGFIAAVIGYLPVLYQLFARREAHVIQLDARAGSPPSAGGLLLLHAELGGLGEIDGVLRQWETWSAELLESHLSYPMLVFYRSQHDDQSWLGAMTAVMDSCALLLVGLEGRSAVQARMTFTMTRGAIVEMCRALGVRPSQFDGGDRLPPAEFRRLDAALREAGLCWKDGSGEAEDTLVALRATYEPLLDGLGRRLLLGLPPWLAAADAVGHWEGGHRGMIARRLVAQLAAEERENAAGTGGGADRNGERLGQRVRRRLRRR